MPPQIQKQTPQVIPEFVFQASISSLDSRLIYLVPN